MQKAGGKKKKKVHQQSSKTSWGQKQQPTTTTWIIKQKAPTTPVQSKPRSGKGTQTDSSISVRHSCQKTCESAVENGQQAEQSHRWSFSFKNHKVSQGTLMAQSPKTSQGGASLARKVQLPSMKIVQPIPSQPPAWQWRWKQSPMPSSGLPQGVTDHTCDNPHRLSELAINSEKWNGKPTLHMLMVISTFKNFCGCTALDMPEWRQMIEQIDWWAQQPSQVACFLEDLKE